jgi:hypothetical protein
LIDSIQSQSAGGLEEMTLMTVAVESKVSEAHTDNHNANDLLQGHRSWQLTLGATALHNFHITDEVISICTVEWGMHWPAGIEYGGLQFALHRGEYRLKCWM